MSYHDSYVPQFDVSDFGNNPKFKKSKTLKLSIHENFLSRGGISIDMYRPDGTTKNPKELMAEVMDFLERNVG